MNKPITWDDKAPLEHEPFASMFKARELEGSTRRGTAGQVHQKKIVAQIVEAVEKQPSGVGPSILMVTRLSTSHHTTEESSAGLAEPGLLVRLQQ